MIPERPDLFDVKETTLNRTQALIKIINANVLFCLAPRASGKTSGGIGPRILHLSEKMPRAQIGLIADTFERIDKVLLPGLEAYWNEELGLLPDVDYVVHKKPPAHWVKPRFIPKKWDRVVSFASGFILCEISLKISGSANGYNLQAIIGDEIKYWDEKKFKSEVKPAIRGGRKYYGHLPEFQSQWFFTDKFPGKGASLHWILDKKNLCNQEHVDIVYTLQMEVYKKEKEMLQAKSENKMSLYYQRKNEIEEYEAILCEMRKDLVHYCDALPYENLDVLGGKYFRDQERDLSKFEYDVAIENKNPDKAMVPFYPDLAPIHFYKHRYDVDLNLPLIIALDYQHAIVPLCATQYNRLPDAVYNTLNWKQSMHVLGPQGIEDVINLFCETFKHHSTKVVYYVHDQTAIGRSPAGKTFKEIVVDTLTNNHWNVTDIYMGDTPDHYLKQQVIKKWLNVQGDKAIRMNEDRNQDLKSSLEMAPAKIVNGVTKKDKSSEKEDSGVPPQKATHFSDVFDQLVWSVLELELVPLVEDTGMDIIMGSRK